MKKVIEGKEDDCCGKCLSVGQGGVQSPWGGDFSWRKAYTPPSFLEGRRVLESWAARFNRRMLKGSSREDLFISSANPEYMTECKCCGGVYGETEVLVGEARTSLLIIKILCANHLEEKKS